MYTNIDVDIYYIISDLNINNTLYSWDEDDYIQSNPGFNVQRFGNNSILVSLVERGISFKVNRVEPTDEHTYYLDFHLLGSGGLSKSTTGLVGKLSTQC